MRKNKGITLIALVITIIVLLILAGISLNLVTGSDGILSKAAIAVQRTEEQSAKEQAEIVVADYVSEFYDKKYVQGETTEDAKSYVKSALAEGKKEGNYFLKTEGNKIEVYKNETQENAIVTGTIKNGGKIDWSNSEEMITFTVRVSSSIAGSGEKYSFKAYEGETWAEWVSRMQETGEWDSLDDIMESQDAFNFKFAFRKSG